MTLRHYDPLEVLNRFLSTETGYASYPVHDIYVDQEDNLTFDFALAGFSKDEINIELNKNVLTVYASKSKGDSDVSKAKAWIHQKIATRDFDVRYTFPNAYNSEEAKASFVDGVLTIKIPQAEVVKSKLLTIE